MRRRPFRRLHLLRRLILATLVLMVLAVAGLFWLGRVARPPTRPGVGGDTDLGGEEVTYEAEGFDHTVTIGDRRLFRVRAERTASGAEGRQPKLQEVELTYFREDGSEYAITGDSGSYDLKTQAARLEGGVVVRGPQGFDLRTDRLRLAPRSEWLASARGVTFQINERLSGNARQLRADLDNNIFRLDGPVTISGSSEDGERLALRARRVVYERDRQFIRAEGQPVLRHGNSRLRARRVSVELDEEGGDVRFLAARWRVEGHIQNGETHRIGVAADELQGEFYADSGELRRLELTGQPARVNESQGAALVRRLRGSRVVARFTQAGVLEQVVAAGNAQIVEQRHEAGEVVTRTSRAESMNTHFGADGNLAAAELSGDVSFRDGTQEVRGDRAILRPGSDTVVVTGKPARALQEGKELRGPELRYEVSTHIVRGDQGIQAVFQPQENVELPAAKRPPSRPPLHIDAESLEVDTQQRSFVFTGRVRAWQGASYLLADRLTGSEAGQLLTADGQIKTVWEQAAQEGGEEAAPPTEITGSRLLYSRAVRHLTYFGPATVIQGPRRMRCGRIEAQLDEQEQARRMLCIGDVRINDRETGQQATGGQQAVYETATGEILVTGDPVILRHRDGRQVQGKQLVYNLDDGSARVLSRAGEASSTSAASATAQQPAGAAGEEGGDDG